MLLQVLAESLQMRNEAIETQLEMLAGPAAVMGQSYWIAVALLSSTLTTLPPAPDTHRRQV